MLRDSDSRSDGDVSGQGVCSGGSVEVVARHSVANDGFVDVKKKFSWSS